MAKKTAAPADDSGEDENKEEKAKTKEKSPHKSVPRVNIELDKYKQGMVVNARENPVIERVSTGLAELDHILGGGYPIGKIIQVGGKDKSGKTTIAYEAINALQKKNPGKVCLFIDAEGTFDPERAELFGINLDFLYICRPECAEDAFLTMRKYLLTDCCGIILDSVPFLLPEKVMENDVGDLEVAPVARFLGIELPKLRPFLKRSKAVVIFINQLREKIGGPPAWGDNTHLPGGRTLQHESSLILKIARKQAIKVSEDEVGQFIKVKVDNTKVSVPKKECILNLIYDRGFVSNDSLDEVKKEVHEINKNIEKNRKKHPAEVDEDDE